MNEALEKRIVEAEALSTSLLKSSDGQFKREDGQLDIDAAAEQVAESSRVIGELIESVRELDVAAEKAKSELEEITPRAEAAKEVVAVAQNEARRLLNIVAVARKGDEEAKAKLEDFNKRAEEGTIEVAEVLEVQKAARKEYYDLFPAAVVSRIIAPDACPECGSARAEDAEECVCGVRFEKEANDQEESSRDGLGLDLESFRIK